MHRDGLSVKTVFRSTNGMLHPRYHCILLADDIYSNQHPAPASADARRAVFSLRGTRGVDSRLLGELVRSLRKGAASYTSPWLQPDLWGLRGYAPACIDPDGSREEL